MFAGERKMTPNVHGGGINSFMQNRNSNNPLKIVDKKPMTPDYTVQHQAQTKNVINNSNNYPSNYGIKRNNSNFSRKEERPSTAPAKENKEVNNRLQPNNSLKRLPSPAIKRKL